MSAKVSLVHGRYGAMLPLGNSRPTIPLQKLLRRKDTTIFARLQI